MADVYYPPSDADGGWRALKSARKVRKQMNVDVEGLDAAFEYAKGSTKNGGLLVVRHGHLIYEQYFGKGCRDAAPNQGSCGKSFTSIAVGVLMDEYPELFPDGLDQKVFRTTHLPPRAFPLTDKRKAEITLGQLMTFSGGIRGNNPCYVNGEEVEIDPVGPDGWQGMEDERAAGKLEDAGPNGQTYSVKELWCEPGGGYSFATASIHIASMMVRHITERELEQYLRDRVAPVLGWGTWSFGYRHTDAGKHTPGGGGIAIRAMDMMRTLYLLLQGGRWGDQQVVPEWYVDHASKVSPYNPHYPYSLQFTCNSTGLDPDLPTDAYWKAGSGGHAMYVVPSLDMVVWKLGGRDEQFTERNTGLSEIDTGDDREGWEKTVEDGEALRGTLKRVCEAAV
ncbi:TPA: serine hydrolase [Candidatus Latescibacteria bacterium]|nr:serine hydrolase [Candidatus Latescibacterota bacterium]